MADQPPLSIGATALLGALMGGGLGAGASAISTGSREGESKKDRLKRMLRNALAGGVMGAGAGAAGGGAIGMVGRMKGPPTGLEGWQNWRVGGDGKDPKSGWAPFGPASTTAVGAGIGGVTRSLGQASAARNANIEGILKSRMAAYEQLMANHGEAFERAQAGQISAGAKPRFDETWKAILGKFGGQSSNALKMFQDKGIMPNEAQMHAIQKGMIAGDKYTHIPGLPADAKPKGFMSGIRQFMNPDSDKVKTFTSFRSRWNNPDMARFGPLQTGAPTLGQRAGYRMRQFNPINRGAAYGGIGGLALGFAPAAISRLANYLDE